MPKEPEAEKTARLRKLRLEAEARRPKPEKRIYQLHKMDSVLRFGKYTGSSIEEVLEADYEWIQRAIDNIDDFEVDDEVIEFIHYLSDPRKPIDRDR